MISPLAVPGDASTRGAKWKRSGGADPALAIVADAERFLAALSIFFDALVIVGLYEHSLC